MKEAYNKNSMEEHQDELTGKQIGLPGEMMHEILSRLPVKPLCRFKCVSKQWLSVISNPKFIAMHSKAIENKEVFFQRRRLVFTDRLDHRLYSLDLGQFLNQNCTILKNRKENMDNLDVDVPAAEATELDFVYNLTPGGRRQQWCPFTLSFNSLLLSQSFSGYHLIDPVTKESKKLPKTPKWRRTPFVVELYGLGFDHSTNEYKVVKGQLFADSRIVFNVYTMETDSWRRIMRLFPFRLYGRDDGIMVNGCVHWLLLTLTDQSLLILSFHLAEEKFRKLLLPSFIGSNIGSYQLGVFRDWLCLTFSSSLAEAETYNEFWVMKKYGVRGSWTKILRVSIPYHTLSHFGFWRGSYDLMVFDGSSFVMYNFDDEEFWTLAVKNIGEVGSIGIYVESHYTLLLLKRLKQIGPEKVQSLISYKRLKYACLYNSR